MDLNIYNQKISYLSFETVRELARTKPDINNVLRGYSKRSFGVIGDLKKSNEISFVHFFYAMENPAIVISLKFREENFYDYLLCFSTEIARENPDLEIISIYNTFTNSFMSFLGVHDIEPLFSADLEALPRGELFIPSEYEIIKSFDRVKFYRDILGCYNYRNFKENTEYVYIMMNKDDMTFKIGQSTNPRYRERTLQSKEPQIALLKVWESNKKVEKELHSIYKNKRLRGEWFKLDYGDLSELDEIIKKLIVKNNNAML